MDDDDDDNEEMMVARDSSIGRVISANTSKFAHRLGRLLQYEHHHQDRCVAVVDAADAAHLPYYANTYGAGCLRKDTNGAWKV